MVMEIHYTSDLILRSALFARVSKDGREFTGATSILRDAAKRPLLRMRSVFVAAIRSASPE
jgi:hypothetical protein